MRRVRFPLVLSLLVLLYPAFAIAEIPDLIWEEPETIDSPVYDVSSSSGTSVLFWEGEWRVVYETSSEICYCARDESGWLSPVQLSSGAVNPRSPHLAGTNEHLHVVWEDLRDGHPEVYTRRFDGSSWSAEECLTCDAVASRGPAIAAEYSLAVLVWEDSSGTDFRAWARFFEYGAWEPPEELSTHTADARDPTVALDPNWGWIFAAWADYRHGAPEIYVRGTYGAWWYSAEERLTNLSVACRHPSAHTEMCCGDAITELPFVAFEGTGASGVPEAWVARKSYDYAEATRLSPDDGVPSTAPNAGGFAFPIEGCGVWGLLARFFVTWTDETGPGSNTHHLSYNPAGGLPVQQEALPGLGLAHSAVGAIEGSPDAGVMVVWIDDSEGVPTLVSRLGSLPGCSNVELQAPQSILLAPAGNPATYVRMIETCSGQPVEGAEVWLEFENALDQALTWDPLQQHPFMVAETNENGYAVFPILGGGCSGAGSVILYCGGLPAAEVLGAKSPDVDGDCWVTFEDLLYISMMMGTDDFCADLDGSGEVDGIDVALANEAYGDHCSHVESVEESTSLHGEPTLIAFPNPTQGATSLRLALPAPASVDIRIVDAGGRLVREFDSQNLTAGLTPILWDLQDSSKRQVRSGVYFATARVDHVVLRRPILVVR